MSTSERKMTPGFQKSSRKQKKVEIHNSFNVFRQCLKEGEFDEDRTVSLKAKLFLLPHLLQQEI